MKQYLELTPISVPPKKEGWYTLCNRNGLHADTVEWRGKWLYRFHYHTHYLAPVEGVLVSEEELYKAFRESDLTGPQIRSFINSLTNKANQ